MAVMAFTRQANVYLWNHRDWRPVMNTDPLRAVLHTATHTQTHVIDNLTYTQHKTCTFLVFLNSHFSYSLKNSLFHKRSLENGEHCC